MRGAQNRQDKSSGEIIPNFGIGINRRYFTANHHYVPITRRMLQYFGKFRGRRGIIVDG
jgi:hypothetical protein